MYSINDLGEKEQMKVKWIDKNEGNKDVLRTNASEDDLCLKDIVNEINCHWTATDVKTIMKRPEI